MITKWQNLLAISLLSFSTMLLADNTDNADKQKNNDDLLTIENCHIALAT